jgi:hypothetical protein
MKTPFLIETTHSSFDDYLSKLTKKSLYNYNEVFKKYKKHNIVFVEYEYEKGMSLKREFQLLWGNQLIRHSSIVAPNIQLNNNAKFFIIEKDDEPICMHIVEEYDNYYYSHMPMYDKTKYPELSKISWFKLIEYAIEKTNKTGIDFGGPCGKSKPHNCNGNCNPHFKYIVDNRTLCDKYKYKFVYLTENEKKEPKRYIVKDNRLCIKEMELHEILNNINYIILRGFEKINEQIPVYPDDIDILTDDYDKAHNLLLPYLITIDNPEVGHIIQLGDVKTKIDIRVIGDNYYDKNWEQSMLANKKIHGNYYVMGDDNYKYSILYHCLYHKKQLSAKYLHIVNTLFKTTHHNELVTILGQYMEQNNYEVLKPKDVNCGFFPNNGKAKRMLFLIRKTGLERHPDIIKYTQIALKLNKYNVIEQGIVTINKNEDFLRQLYKNITNESVFEHITKCNHNTCYYIITDYTNYTKNSIDMKKLLRDKFPNPDNQYWNYFHSSDNEYESESEIDLLKNSNNSSFTGIGTYYTQKEV